MSVLDILVLGAEGVGKSLLIKRLHYLAANGIDSNFDEEIPPTVPTVGNDIVKVKFNHKEYKLREVGGAMAPIWKNYYCDTNAVIYIIDKSNQFQISASCMMLLTALSNKNLQGKDILILFNKNDFKSTFSFDQLKKIFRIKELEMSKKQKITVLECSSVKKHGYCNIVKWLEVLS